MSSAAMFDNDTDTIVVPSHDDNFQGMFLNENHWCAIHIGRSKISLIKYIAIYRVAPVSAITHVATVSNITPWEEDKTKFCLKFVEPARVIGPIAQAQSGPMVMMRGSRYTSIDRLTNARTLSDVFN